MSYRSGLAMLLIFCGLSLVQEAEGQPKGKIPAETLNKAKARFDEAEGFYRVGDYARALEGYKEAYLLARKPAILFNMAQCYRYLKEHEDALRTYQLFLSDDPNTPVREEVEGIIAALEATIAQQKPVPTTPEPTTTPASTREPQELPVSAPIQPPSEKAAPRYDGPRRATFYLLSGATAVAGGALGLAGLRAVNNAKVLHAQLEDPADPRVGEVLQGYRASRAFGVASDLLFASALLSAGAGVYFSLEQRQFEAKLQAQPGAISLLVGF